MAETEAHMGSEVHGKRGSPLPITASVLAWAVRESGRERASIAQAAGVVEGRLAEWLSGDGGPNRTQLQKLAHVLKRPAATFFLPKPPRLARPEVEFRSPSSRGRRAPSPEERVWIREIARLQRGLAWVAEELGDPLSALPKLAITANAEDAAERVRSVVGISAADQLAWKSASDAQHGWRAALEDLGIGVLFLPLGEESVQGFSLWHERVPLIAANTHWKAQARSYTMLHELAHLLTRTSSLCAKELPHSAQGGDRVERWCEEFAAAFLMPWTAVEVCLRERFAWRLGAPTTLDHARYLANRFHVSLPAAVLRLVSKDAAGWGLFRAIPPATDRKPGGGPPGEGGRRRPQKRLDEFGVRATSTFLRGVRSDAITRDDALRYLDVADSEIEELEALAAAR